MRLVLLGAPGSGKGTLAAELKKTLNIAYISTGVIFRANIKENTSLGKEANSYIEKGHLVPDRITVNMLRERLLKEDAEQGFILDGFPRTLFQAEALDRILRDLGIKLDFVIQVIVSDETIKKRLSSRRVCISCGENYNNIFKRPKAEGVCDICSGEVIQRQDDKEETILTRLKVYEEQTAPLIDYYASQNLIIPAQNEKDVADTFEQVLADLKRKGFWN